MGVTDFLKLYLLTAVVFFAIDLVWLGVVAVNFYNRHLGSLLAEQVRWVPAILFYLIFIAGLLVFAVQPGLSAVVSSAGYGIGRWLGIGS